MNEWEEEAIGWPVDDWFETPPQMQSAAQIVDAYYAAHNALLSAVKSLGLDADDAILCDERESTWSMKTLRDDASVVGVTMKSTTPNHNGTLAKAVNVHSADGLTFVLSTLLGKVLWIFSDAKREAA